MLIHRAAWGGLVQDLPSDRNFWSDVLKRIRRRAHGQDDPEDLLHAAYIKLEHYRTEHTVRNPKGFLVKVALNIAVDNHRRRQMWEEDAESTVRFADELPLQDEVIAARVRLERVKEGLGQLPNRTREIFLMHRIHGLKYREIAERTGISQSAVEKHIARAALFLTEWTKDW
jgi:RNA polymerase sigma factor (sigma-70 family)